MRRLTTIKALLICLVLMPVLAIGKEAPLQWRETARKLLIVLQRSKNFDHYKQEIFVDPNDQKVSQCDPSYIDNKVKEILKVSEYNKVESNYFYTEMSNTGKHTDESADLFFIRVDELKSNSTKYKFSGFFHIHFTEDAKIYSCALYLEQFDFTK